jgi:hypothetical protein
MRTIEIKLYKFEELSEEVQNKVLDHFRYRQVDYEWWKSVYEDAENVGLKITSFDTDRGSYCNFDLINSLEETAEKIIEEHGDVCDTYIAAKKFLAEMNELTSKYEDIEDCPEDEIAELEDEFKSELENCYLKMLRDEYEYLTSDNSIQEMILANDYEFTEDGTLN